MVSTDIFLGLIAVAFPPLPVCIKTGFCSSDLLINILLCMLGFLPGLLHSWYIIAKNPDPEWEYDGLADAEAGQGGGQRHIILPDGGPARIISYGDGRVVVSPLGAASAPSSGDPNSTPNYYYPGHGFVSYQDITTPPLDVASAAASSTQRHHQPQESGISGGQEGGAAGPSAGPVQEYEHDSIPPTYAEAVGDNKLQN